MKTIDEIRDHARVRIREDQENRLERVDEVCTHLGHVISWVQENVDEEDIATLGFDHWGFPQITIYGTTLEHAQATVARMVRECNLRITKRSDFENLDRAWLEWTLTVDVSETERVQIPLTFFARHCRIVETDETKTVPVRKVVCFEPAEADG